MPEAPLFTVVTVTYNSAVWVKEAVQSVLAQSFHDFELIIGDDCSLDNTWQIISEFKDSRIRSFRNDVNIGEYPNRNKALFLAKGKYLLFVDGDDILFKHTLETLSRYVSAFPDAAMIWGISSDVMPFVVFPYLITSEENIKLLYCTSLPITNIGFGEILFKLSILKREGGLNINFALGDTYIKKKIALSEKVLYVSRGMMFWRHSIGQASQHITNNYRSLIERIMIDRELLQLPNSLEEGWIQIIKTNNLVRDTKSIVRNTLLKGKFVDFFRVSKQLGFGLNQVKYLFKKGYFSYVPVDDISKPLKNNYNLE